MLGADMTSEIDFNWLIQTIFRFINAFFEIQVISTEFVVGWPEKTRIVRDPQLKEG